MNKVTDVNKPELGDRTEYLGASDYPVICGSCEYKTFDMLVAEKKGLIKNEITFDFFVKRGDKFEEDVLDEYEIEHNVVVERQFEAKHLVLRNKAHLDGLIDNKDGTHKLIEVKTKCIPKEYTDDQDYIDLISEVPPKTYIDQMINQYYLAKYHSGLQINGCELIIGLYRGKGNTPVAKIYLDVSKQVMEAVQVRANMLDEVSETIIDEQISYFWECVNNPDYVFDAKTMLEIKRYEMSQKAEELKNHGTDVEASVEDSKLLTEYKAKRIKLSELKNEIGAVSGRLAEIEAELLEKHPDAKSIGDDFNKVFISVKLDSGRYTPAKPESVVPPKFKKVVDLG